MKHDIILVRSKKMDRNVNANRRRNEHQLIRLGRRAREHLGLMFDKVVELWPSGEAQSKTARSKVLTIYQAYSVDLKDVKKNMPEEDYLRVGFVTSATFDYLCGGGHKNKENIWIADSVEEIAIGADPEFALLDGNEFIYAAQVDGLMHQGKLASDGPLAEIRPTPEIEIETLVKNIQQILKDDSRVRLISKYNWFADPYYLSKNNYADDVYYPIGGHIHIGTPGIIYQPLANDVDKKYLLFGMLHFTLNYFLGIPFMIIEGTKKSALRRTKCHYGQAHDFRTDRGRLEYRVLSGAWMKHPVLAKIVLGVAKAVAEAYYKYIESDTKVLNEKFHNRKYGDGKLYQSSNKLPQTKIGKEFGISLTRSEMHDLLVENTAITNKLINEILNKLKQLPTYNNYSEYIDMFIDLVKRGQVENLDISNFFKTAWKRNTKFKYLED